MSRVNTRARVGMASGAILLFAGFVALGTWQVQRRAWKLDLIARAEARVHAPAVPAPPSTQWSHVSAANGEYRHVRVTGTFLNESETVVQAVTELGPGFWVLTPLRLADGSVVLINRGFVTPERRDRAAHGAGEPTPAAAVTGLLRMTEPGGGFLRRNDAARNLWYSRDVQAIAAARGLRQVAPYFIDAEAGNDDRRRVADVATGVGGEASGGGPVGGLTVIAFRNSHLVYAITWYGLALLVVAGAWIVIREERRRA